MERKIRVDGNEVRLRASAAIPRMYRIKFQRDIIQVMRTIQREVQRAQEAREAAGEEASSLPLDALTLFENVAYLMARHADPEGVPESVDAWLDGFGTFSIYTVFPVIQELWEAAAVSTMKEMVLEYREAAAKLSMRLEEKRAAGASPWELASLREALRDIREAQRLMDGYYDVPRSEKLAAVGWRARRTRDDH